MIRPGDRAEIRHSFGPDEVAALAALGGPAGDTVPEPLIGALFSCLLGMHLPGPGTNYLKQEMAFLAAVPPGAALRASVTVTRVRPDKGLVDLHAECHLEDGTPVCAGRALVRLGQS